MELLIWAGCGYLLWRVGYELAVLHAILGVALLALTLMLAVKVWRERGALQHLHDYVGILWLVAWGAGVAWGLYSAVAIP
ncbi:MAG: hypothetical protein QY311_00400 [Candidatus Paceibacterota bacterium]|nr:MAG: hypothetical protein QY311_00400 [Candidatus Paceibacterota bacterium]